jgi:hypothetical protein
MEIGMTADPFCPPISVLIYTQARPLPIVLARRIVATEPSDPYMAILARLFRRLPNLQRAECVLETVRVWEDSLREHAAAASAIAPRLP